MGKYHILINNEETNFYIEKIDNYVIISDDDGHIIDFHGVYAETLIDLINNNGHYVKGISKNPCTKES